MSDYYDEFYYGKGSRKADPPPSEDDDPTAALDAWDRGDGEEADGAGPPGESAAAKAERLKRFEENLKRIAAEKKRKEAAEKARKKAEQEERQRRAEERRKEAALRKLEAKLEQERRLAEKITASDDFEKFRHRRLEEKASVEETAPLEPGLAPKDMFFGKREVADDGAEEEDDPKARFKDMERRLQAKTEEKRRKAEAAKRRREAQEAERQRRAEARRKTELLKKVEQEVAQEFAFEEKIAESDEFERFRAQRLKDPNAPVPRPKKKKRRRKF